MSSNSSNVGAFNAQKWKEAMEVAKVVVASRLVPSLESYNRKLDQYNKTMVTGSCMPPELMYGFGFACDITAPPGTYPRFDDQASGNDGTNILYMSADVFAHFISAPTLCVRRFVRSVIDTFNSSVDSTKSSSTLSVRYLQSFKHRGHNDYFGEKANTTHSDIFWECAGMKVVHTAQFAAASSSGSGGSWFFGRSTTSSTPVEDT